MYTPTTTAIRPASAMRAGLPPRTAATAARGPSTQAATPAQISVREYVGSFKDELLCCLNGDPSRTELSSHCLRWNRHTFFFPLHRTLVWKARWRRYRE